MNPERISIPAFIAKLWDMVNNAKYDNLIQWSKDGTSFLIKDPTKFCSDLLPIYYKHNNLASFCRQLNKYGFRKVVAIDSASLKNDRPDLEFSHPCFLKDYPVLLNDIKRQVSEKSKDSNYPDVMVKIVNEVQQLKQKQEILESKLKTMKNENTALWQEHSLLRHKHQNLQKLLNKLIQFLLTLVQQTRGLNIKRINLPLMLKDRSQPKDGLAAIKNHSHNKKPNTNEINCGDDVDIIVPDILSDSDANVLLDDLNNFNNSSTSNVNVLDEEATYDNPLSLVAVPLQEVSPAIVYGKPVDLPNALDSKSIKIENTKKAQKRKSTDGFVPIAPKKILKPSSILSTNNKKSKPLYKIITPKVNQTSETPVYEVVIDNSVVPQESKTFVVNNSPGYQISIIDNSKSNNKEENPTSGNESIPIISSPSGTVLSPGTTIEAEDDKANTNTAVVVNDQSLEPLSKDIDNHIGAIQSDLDVLKDLLQGEGISLDASTLLGFFNEDPLSLNMPEAGPPNSNEAVGNELMTYCAPSLMDMVKNLDDNESQECTSIPMSTLNTPKPELLYDYSLPSPSKKMK